MGRYNAVARSFHWIIALLIIANLWLGIAHESLPKEWKVMPLHKSIGLTVLALSILRLVWRLTHAAPALPAAMPAWEKSAAHLTHWIFYAFMILVPLSGWIMSSANQYPLNWFSLFDVPKFTVAKGDAIVGIAHEGHEIMGFAWLALVVLHIVAALRHHFVLKDGVLRRML